MKCEICRKDFNNANHLYLHNISPKEYYLKFIDDRDLCSNIKCNSPVSFKGLNKGFSKYCSNKCAASCRDEVTRQIRIKENNIKKYGVEHAFQADSVKRNIINTNLERYGVENPQQNKEIKKKTNSTNLERYGYENVQQNKEIKNKTSKTNKEKYGGNAPTSSKIIIKKREDNNLEKYGVKHLSQLRAVKDKMKVTNLLKYGQENYQQRNIINSNLLNKEYILNNFINDKGYLCREELCEFYNISIVKFYRLLIEFNIDIPTQSNKGKIQQEIFDFIYSDNKKYNDKSIIPPKELDIYLPNNNIAIEFDGLLYHSYGKSIYSTFDNYTDETYDYHLNKTKECEDKNIKLLHIFENEWIDPTKKEIWKSVINNKIGICSEKIFARKTKIINLTQDNTIVDKFLEENHLQGKCKSSIKLGLIYEGKIVSIMTFGKSRYSIEYDWELIRFCNKLNTVIVGGASKLFKYFIREYNPSSIISFANLRWSDGNLYNKLGFIEEHRSKPNYYYFKINEMKLYNRQKFQKHKLYKLLEIFNPELSETLNMYNNGYRKIYDCGNIVFRWDK